MILIIGGANQGKTEYAKKNYSEYVIVDSHHLIVRKQLEENKNPQEEILREIKVASENTVFISDEVGYGIVPMDSFERKYRDEVGRVNQILAKNAEHVIRIVAGFAQTIK